jgi:hypothetical protein
MNRYVGLLATLLAVTPGVLTGQRVGLQLGALVQSTRRSVAVDTFGGLGSATAKGIEGTLRLAVLRLDVRVLQARFAGDSGTFGRGSVTSGGATLGVGNGRGWVEGGIGRRALSGGFSRRVWQYTQVGAGVRLPLAGSLNLQLRGAAYLSLKESGGSSTGSGRLGETILCLTPATFPIYLQVGYRVETLQVDGGGRATPEEQSGLIAGGGIRLGHW